MGRAVYIIKQEMLWHIKVKICMQSVVYIIAHITF